MILILNFHQSNSVSLACSWRRRRQSAQANCVLAMAAPKRVSVGPHSRPSLFRNGHDKQTNGHGPRSDSGTQLPGRKFIAHDFCASKPFSSLHIGLRCAIERNDCPLLSNRLACSGEQLLECDKRNHIIFSACPSVQLAVDCFDTQWQQISCPWGPVIERTSAPRVVWLRVEWSRCN